MTGDLTGFAAATYLRGIDFIQIPTTLLAQVDSSVGGKTGVDFQQYKNMVGAFHQPKLVFMNMETLKTLPDREFACGMGEILKTGLICDGDFFRSVCREQERIRSLDNEALAFMIRRCCEIKAGVVERDPKEQGERALLNLGHTIGHALESWAMQKGQPVLHGYAVAWGLVCELYLSARRQQFPTDQMHQTLQFIRQHGFIDQLLVFGNQRVVFSVNVGFQFLGAEKVSEQIDNAGKSVLDRGHETADKGLGCLKLFHVRIDTGRDDRGNEQNQNKRDQRQQKHAQFCVAGKECAATVG